MRIYLLLNSKIRISASLSTNNKQAAYIITYALAENDHTSKGLYAYHVILRLIVLFPTLAESGYSSKSPFYTLRRFAPEHIA